MSVRTNPILVTGSHRSGSTWVGTALGLADGVAVIREPFHPRKRQSWLAGHVDRFFLHVDDHSPQELKEAIADMVEGRPPITRHVTSVRSPRHAAATARDLGKLAWWRTRGHRLLFKDPIGFFAAEYLADTHDAEVTVQVRHPAAFAGSLKRLDWRFRFSDLGDQPSLMNGHLAPFADQVAAYAESPPDVIDQAILLWRIFGSEADRWRNDRPDFAVTRYEDIATDPMSGIEALYQHHGLTFGPEQRQGLAQMTAAEHGTDVANPLEVRRDSRAAAYTWTSRLTAEEIHRVRVGTEDVAARFYTDADWQIDDAPTG